MTILLRRISDEFLSQANLPSATPKSDGVPRGNWALVLRSMRCQLGDLHSSKEAAPADGVTQPDTESWVLEAARARTNAWNQRPLVSDSSLQKVSAHNENKTGEGDRKRKDAGGGSTSSFASSNRGVAVDGTTTSFWPAPSCFVARRSHGTHHFVLGCFLKEGFLMHFLLT